MHEDLDDGVAEGGLDAKNPIRRWVVACSVTFVADHDLMLANGTKGANVVTIAKLNPTLKLRWIPNRLVPRWMNVGHLCCLLAILVMYPYTVLSGGYTRIVLKMSFEGNRKNNL